MFLPGANNPEISPSEPLWDPLMGEEAVVEEAVVEEAVVEEAVEPPPGPPEPPPGPPEPLPGPPGRALVTLLVVLVVLVVVLVVLVAGLCLCLSVSVSVCVHEVFPGGCNQKGVRPPYIASPSQAKVAGAGSTLA